MADQIVARCEAGWNGGLPVQILVHFGGAPTAAGEGWGRHAFLVNLEPVGTGSVALFEVAGALVHPDHDGTLFVGPLLPDGFDFGTRGDGGVEVGGGAAVAHDFLVVD